MDKILKNKDEEKEEKKKLRGQKLKNKKRESKQLNKKKWIINNLKKSWRENINKASDGIQQFAVNSITKRKVANLSILKK